MGEHQAVDDRHDAVRHALASLEIALGFPRGFFHDEIRHGDDDFRQEEEDQKNRPAPVKGDEGKRCEKGRVNEIANRVEIKFGGDLGSLSRKARFPFVVVNGVEGAEKALDKK